MKFGRKIIAVVLVMVFGLTVFLPSLQAGETPQQECYVLEEGTLINYEQGYSFAVPEGFALNDEFYPINLRLESKDTVVEIYQEDLKGNDGRIYISYTNKGIIDNETDYQNVKLSKKKNITTLSWNRKKLAKIENDKNYYLKIDITSKDMVHTILVKSTQPIEDDKQYIDRFSVTKKYSVIDQSYEKKVAAQRCFNAETQKLYDEVFKNSQELSWGIFHPQYMQDASLKQYEQEINREFDFLLWYVGFTESYNARKMGAVLQRAYMDGKTVEMTLQPVLEHEAGNELFRVLDGEYDAFLNDFAKAIVDFKHPVLFRFCNEMNGDWCEYSGYHMSLDTELYRELYRYVYSFFEKYQADNVIWVWNPNGKSFPNYKWNVEDMYYPGNDYVDVLGLTLYNTGNYYIGEEWSTFADLYTPLYNHCLEKYDMPFMITEFACARTGGDKEAWTREMLAQIDGYENIKIAIWWNSADIAANGEISRSYYINDTEEMKMIFKQYFEK